MKSETKQFYKEQNEKIDNILKTYYTNSDYKLIEEQIKNKICQKEDQNQ